MEQNIILETKLVGAISGNFFIDSYQRGYRWGEEEVIRLLEDIYNNGDSSYCLQPIVVKNLNDKFELIDGQQRLTTLFLIYEYMHQIVPNFYGKPKFMIDYRIKEDRRDFLNNIDLTKENDNIDFYFLCNAYKTIKGWFSTRPQQVLTKFYQYLEENVKVIWYEVDKNVNSSSLFTRLNIGKIPLTSSELIKATFLKKNVDNEQIFQEEIALQWDNIERELHNDKFWYFLTNNYANEYQTRIDLILDLIAEKKPEDSKKKYFTFFKIDEMIKKNPSFNLEELWKKIQHTYLILKDWFENHELYHKIGYLISTNSVTLQEIYNDYEKSTKEDFIKDLNDYIKNSIKLDKNHKDWNYSELNYHDIYGYKMITKLLTLFNIESVRKNGEKTQWFPFDKFKTKNDKKVVWSLEHIHAQHSKSLTKQSEWEIWLEKHLESVKVVDNQNVELINKIQECLSNPKIEGTTFTKLQEEVLKILSDNNILYNMDTIANLALLEFKDNSALNNSTFDVKRDLIIEMDQNGEYVPFCTRMVFLKYYTKSKDNQIHFWAQQDMESYIEKINEVLEPYMEGNIIKYEKEVPENE